MVSNWIVLHFHYSNVSEELALGWLLWSKAPLCRNWRGVWIRATVSNLIPRSEKLWGAERVHTHLLSRLLELFKNQKKKKKNSFQIATKLLGRHLNTFLVLCCCCCCVASVVSNFVRPHRWLPNRLHPGILQARTLESVAISFSNAWKWKVKVKSLRRVRPSVTPWTAASQAPPSMGFSRQEYWT